MRPFPVVLLIPLTLAAVAPRARAAKGEKTLSVSAAYTEFCLNQEPQPNIGAAGGLLMVEHERGLTDVLWVRGAVGGGTYSDGIYSVNAVAGLSFVLDILKYVPYLTAGLGVAYIDGGPVGDGAVHTFLEFGAGLEILHSRTFSYGVNLRLDSFASDLALGFHAGARVTWRWGFF